MCICSLHVFVLVASPKHAFPPFNAGVVSDRERVFSPPPHDFEQDDQSPKGPQTQSTECKYIS